MSADIPTYDLTRQECGKEYVSCSAGDEACVARATQNGLVSYARHGATLNYCPPDALGTRPTGLGLLALGILAIMIGLVIFVRRMRKTKSSKPEKA